MTTEKLKESMTFEGWNFWVWLKGNGKTLKEVFKIGLPLLLGLTFIQENPAVIGLVTIIGKLICDSLEFYVSEVKLK